jgi:hypothetical protein
MFRDPIIDEIRQARHKIEADCGNNSQKYYEHIQQVQERFRNRIVRLRPKPAVKKQKVAG